MSRNSSKTSEAAKELQKAWLGKDYAECAAHHQELLAKGLDEEAAEFHESVIAAFQSDK